MPGVCGVSTPPGRPGIWIKGGPVRPASSVDKALTHPHVLGPPPRHVVVSQQVQRPRQGPELLLRPLHPTRGPGLTCFPGSPKPGGPVSPFSPGGPGSATTSGLSSPRGPGRLRQGVHDSPCGKNIELGAPDPESGTGEMVRPDAAPPWGERDSALGLVAPTGEEAPGKAGRGAR